MSELRIYIHKHIRMCNVNIIKDKNIGLEYECVELDSNTLPADIDAFFPRDWFAHWSWGWDCVWDYIIWDFIKIKKWDIVIKCIPPDNEQIDESELLSYKSDLFLKRVGHRHSYEGRKIWLSTWAQCWNKMIFVLPGEDIDLLYGKSIYDNFSYLKI